MINSYHTQIEKIYEQLKDKETLDLKRRKNELYKKCPEISDIEAKIGSMCIKLSLAAIKEKDNNEHILKSLKDEIINLRARKYELLVSFGYPQDYLEIHYSCPHCKDTGYIGINKCSCYTKKLIQLHYIHSDLRDMLKKNNFDNFNMELFPSKKVGDEQKSPQKNMQNILKNSFDFIKNFSSSSENLLFYGNSGTGKTFLSHCIAKELLDKGYMIVYRTAESLIQDLRKIKLEHDLDLEDVLVNCDLLIIDDLGTEQISVFSKAEFFNLLNRKLLKNKKMIISTNYTLEELSKNYSERITSRLFGNFTLYKFFGEDIRVKMNLKKSDIY